MHFSGENRGEGDGVFVEVKVVGQPTHTVDREMAAEHGATTLRVLLSELVAGEVAGYAARRADQRLLHVLTAGEVAAAQRSGSVRSGGRTVAAPPRVEDAIARALQAFTDGLVHVFLDGKPVEDLDAALTVGPGTRLRLLRLVALAGG